MKWIDNFKVHQVDGDQRMAHLTYLDIGPTEEPNWLKEGEAQMAELSIKPQTLQMQLEKKRVQAQVSKEQVEDLKRFGIDAFEETKSALKSECDLNLTKDLFKEVSATARVLESTQEFTGFKAWFYNLVGYKPLIWLESDEFLDLILKGSNEIMRRSRMGAGDWIVVSHKTAMRLERLPDFVYGSEGRIADPNEQVNQFGSWKHLKIWTSWLVGDGQVLMGRRSTNPKDPLVSAAVGEAEWLQAETATSDFSIMLNVELQRNAKVFSIPGSEKSYLKWSFEYNKPNFWKWFGKKLIKLSPFRHVIDLIRRRKV
jgi:hypothetical protein